MKTEHIFLVFGITFSTFFGPGCHLAPKPPKTQKRCPKGLQNDPTKLKKNTDNQKKRHANLHKHLHYILHLENKSSEPIGTRPGGMRVAL